MERSKGQRRLLSIVLGLGTLVDSFFLGQLMFYNQLVCASRLLVIGLKMRSNYVIFAEVATSNVICSKKKPDLLIRTKQNIKAGGLHNECHHSGV